MFSEIFDLIGDYGMRIKTYKRSKEDYQLTQIKEFRKLILKMYNGFPNMRIHEDEVKRVIVTEEDRNALVKYGYFIKEKYSKNRKDYYMYGLGPNSLNLISAWNSEELNKRIMRTNFLLVFLGTLTVLVSIIIAQQTITNPLLMTAIFLTEILVILIIFAAYKMSK